MIYRFGDAVLNEDTFELERNGAAVPVEPQVMDLLIHLVRNRDRTLSKDEIFAQIWKGRIVSDSVLSSRISSARAAIGDDGNAQKFIRTLHGRGFRFVGQVWSGGQSPAVDGKALDDLASDIDFSLPSKPSVVVLPFSYAGDDRYRVISNGLTMDITTLLARLRWIFVIARGTAFRFSGADTDPVALTRKMGVKYALVGSVQIADTKVRVHAALSDTEGREVWAEVFDRKLKDVLDLQKEVALLVAAAIEREIEHSEREKAMLLAAEDLDAWSAYHRGCVHMYRTSSADLERAEYFLQNSLALDPGAPRTHAALSYVNWQRAFLKLTGDTAKFQADATRYAERSLEIDPRDPMGHWVMGRALILSDRNEDAIAELAQSVALNPSFALGHYAMSLVLGIEGRFLESAASVAEARRLSPFDPMGYAMLAQHAVNLLMEGSPDQAAEVAERAARQPNAHIHVQFISAYCNTLAGRRDVAAGNIATIRQRNPSYGEADYFSALPIKSGELRRLVRKASKEIW